MCIGLFLLFCNLFALVACLVHAVIEYSSTNLLTAVCIGFLSESYPECVCWLYRLGRQFGLCIGARTQLVVRDGWITNPPPMWS